MKFEKKIAGNEKAAYDGETFTDRVLLIVYVKIIDVVLLVWTNVGELHYTIDGRGLMYFI